MIPGKPITMATLTMALLYIANRKHDLHEMINGTRVVALCLKDAHHNEHTNKDTRNSTEDFEEEMEEVAHRYLDLLSERMTKAEELHQQIVNDTVKEIQTKTAITLESAPLVQKFDNLSNTLLTTTDTLHGFMAQTNVAMNFLKEATTRSTLAVTTAPTPTTTTYTTITQCNTNPEHAEVIAQGQLSDIQILIDFNKDTNESTLTDLTERDMVAKANTALKLMNCNDPDKPQTIKFMATRHIQNN